MSAPNLVKILSTDSFAQASEKIACAQDAIILLLGSYDASNAAKVRSICARAFAPVALAANALLVDDGRPAGLAQQIGQALEELEEVDQHPALLGIIASDATVMSSGRGQLLQLPVEWDDAAKSRMSIVAELRKNGTLAERPVVVVLFGGDDRDKASILRCARRQWPVLIVQGLGGLGDKILTTLATPESPVDDPDLREIIDTAFISALPINGEIDDLTRILLGPIRSPGEVLLNVWSQYDDLDRAAIEKQRRFRTIHNTILTLGVFATLLAVLVSGNVAGGSFRQWLLTWLSAQFLHGSSQLLRVLLILTPISISILTSYNSRFREGNKWVLLRSAAEAIKREAFRYRTRTGEYAQSACGQVSVQLKLAANVRDIMANLVQTEVNRTSVPDVKAENDEPRLQFLPPERYIVERVQEQIQYYVVKGAILDRRQKSLQLGSMIAGGAGTFFAAVHGGVWVALTTALGVALLAKLERDQVENALVQYNIARASLKNIHTWWEALSTWEKTRPRNIDLLVDQTEKALQQETAGWVQQMQTELDKLTEKQESSGNTTAPPKASEARH